MSAAILGSAAAIATGLVSAFTFSVVPEAQAVLSPITDGGGEYAATAVGLLFAFPALAVLTLVAGLSD